MTDIFIVDEGGRFSVGKAPTTKHDESVGFMEALADAFSAWGMEFDGNGTGLAGDFSAATYAGTSILNALITRSGKRLGLITTRGFEYNLLEGRTKEASAGYVLEDILHMAYREHKEPFIPFRRIRGITERCNVLGDVLIPLSERDAELAVEELLDQDIEGLIVCLLFSYRNPDHERRVGEIAREVMRRRGVDVPLYLSAELNPIRREVSRLNTAIVHAYAASPARAQLLGIEEKLHAAGYESPLQMVLSYGKTANIRYPRIYEATLSGPIGGLVGAEYLGELIQEENLVATDMGGTSFDFGVINDGRYELAREPELERMYLNLAMVDLKTIGAGAGTYIRLDPYSNRILLGPDSAGGDPGPVATNMGNETPTIADCNVVLGRLNPDNYLGGRIKLDVEKAHDTFKEKIADPLGLDPHSAAEGIIELMDTRMLNQVRQGMIGRDSRDYVLLGYGGATGLHLAGYSRGVEWKGIATVPWAAAFSAFGCTCMQYAHRQAATADLFIPYQAPAEQLDAGRAQLDELWQDLEEKVVADFEAEGVARGDLKFSYVALMQYNGQLDDLETPCPVYPLREPADVERLVDAFEQVYGEKYPAVARASEAGYRVTEVVLTGYAPTVKPSIPRLPLEGPEPPEAALKETRPVYLDGRWQDVDIWDLDGVRPGNRIDGPVILEGPAYTLMVPSDKQISVDNLRVIWMEAQ